MQTFECPSCRKKFEPPENSPHRPFCSARCKMADLGNWLDENYKISRPAQDGELADDLN